jgi:hypothetical protein
MSSSGLLPSYNFNKLQVNDLYTKSSSDVKTKDETSIFPQYLYSVVADNSTFTPSLNSNDNTATLKIHKSDANIIEFTDRPFRQTNNNFTFEDFVSLFQVTTLNSYNVDPPNGVLIIGEKQATYEVTLESADTESATFNLNLKVFDNETNVFGNSPITGRITLFVDLINNKVKQTYITLYNSSKITNTLKEVTEAEEEEAKEKNG